MTTEPDMVSSAPALAAKAKGMRRRAGLTPRAREAERVTGIMAAAAPLGVINALSSAVTSMRSTRRTPSPWARAAMVRAIHAVMPDAVHRPVGSTAAGAALIARGEADFADKLLSAMRFQFGGHIEKKS